MKKLLTILLAAVGILIPMETWAQDKAYEPYFNFTGDSLVMYSDTENAMILYVMEEFSSDTSEDALYEMAEKLDVNQNGTFYSEPILVTKNVIIKAVAFRQGLEYSDPTVLIYNYDAWQKLLAAVEYGTDVYQRAQNYPNIEQQRLEELQWATEEGQHFYYERGMMPDSHEAEHFTERILELAGDIEALMGQPGQNEAWFDGLTAYVMGEATLDDAFAQTGGRNEAAKTIAAIVWEGNTALTADMLQGISNPNLLVYVNEASQAPQGVQNVVINGQAKEIVLTDVTEGNNNWYCPQAFTAERISYTREFKQHTEVGISRGWESIALPFTVQTITHETQGQIIPFAAQGNGKRFWLRGYSPNGLYSAPAIEANTPYLISMPNNTVVYPEEYNLNGRVIFTANNTTVPATPPMDSIIITRGDITMAPIFQLVQRDEMIYAVNVGQAYDRYPEGSVFVREYRDVRPFEALTIHEPINGARPACIRIGAQPRNETMGIKDIECDSGEGSWYSLDGRKLLSQPKTKGVYIQNGKKVIVR